jgi:hypothetical protein
VQILRIFAVLQTDHTGACKTVDPKWAICYNSSIVKQQEQKMTRKHFIAMAKEISQMPNMTDRLASAIAFCKVAQTTNPRFDQARFLNACKV